MKLLEQTKQGKGINVVSKVLFVSYFPVCVLIAFLTPHDILDYTWARSFANFTARVIPLVAKIGKATPLPELYFIAAAINLMAVIYTFLWLCCALTVDRNYLTEKMSMKFSKIDKVKMFFAVPFAVLGFRFILFNFDPGESALIKAQHVLTSRLGMGICGSYLFLVWYMLGFTMYIFYVLFKQHFQERGKS